MSVQQHTGVIYMLTNQITDERYVGRTTNFPKRMGKYKNGRGHADIGKSIVKHGWENFVVVKLEQGISDIDLPSREEYYITKLKPELNLMASTISGRMRHAESSKQLISAAMKGRKVSPEHRAKLSAAGKGRKASPETCAKLSAANKGKPKSLEHRAKMSVVKRGNKNRLGKKQSPETRAKLSVVNIGKTLSAETRAKLSAAKKGKPKSPEHRAKIGAAKREHGRTMRKHRALNELRAIGWPVVA